MLTFITMELVTALVRRPSYLEGERFFALGLPADDDGADSEKQAQDDAGYQDLRLSGYQLRQAVSQDDTQHGDHHR